jgi:hypothetical protein
MKDGRCGVKSIRLNGLNFCLSYRKPHLTSYGGNQHLQKDPHKQPPPFVLRPYVMFSAWVRTTNDMVAIIMDTEFQVLVIRETGEKAHITAR